ncbi:MAG: FimV/HubP family polar landmark protein [Sideroxyarcus sp.]|nr:FimV/HubP family polar landmark protein [Sideroxyarcus sp.]
MLKSILKTTGYIACLAWSGVVCATGLGGINVSSNLGQPLKAEIELVSVDKADRSSISAKLASAEAFKKAGIDYPYALPKLKFEVVNLGTGESYVKVTSGQAVNEPFVTLLVEITWSTGKLMREYTFLLDPADFKVQEPKAEAVKPIEPVVVTPAVPALSEPTPVAPQAAEPEPVSAPAPSAAVEPSSMQPEAATPAPVESTEAAPVESAPLAEDALSKEEAIPVVESAPVPLIVVRGDTLTKIALQTKPADVSLERMLVALYRANSDAFAGKNMNRLKTGKIIRLPDAAELEAVQQREAVKEFRAQVADWNVYRQQLAAARTEAGDHAGQQESSGKVSTAVAETAPTGKPPAKEVLKLSKGEAPGDKAVGGGKATAQDKKNAKEEEAIAKTKALKEAQERTALLEKNVKDLQKLAELKQQGEAGQAPASPAAVETVADASAVAALPTANQEPKVVTQSSLVDDVLADPVMLAGGVALLLGLGGVGFVLARRGKKTGNAEKTKQETEKQEDAASASGRIAAPVMPSPETGDFTNQSAAGAETPVQSGSDEVDPIGEADLFLTFGRDVQAEEVLKEALKTNPGNIPVKLKLLSIYANRKDTNTFFTYAREIKDSGDEAAWNQASAMGRELEPGNPLYGGDGSSSAQVAEPAADKSGSSVDFDLGFGAPAAATPKPNFQGTVVMEAPSHESTTILSAAELRSAQSTPMDFDVTGTHPGVPAAGGANASASANLDDMVFDVTSTHPGMNGLSASSNTASESSTANADDLIFDVTSTHSGMTSSAPAPAAAPVAEEGLAFTLDFPSDFKAASAAKTETPVDIGLGDISLNLDSLTSTAATSGGGAKDEHWQEVATKLDLAKAYQEMGDAAGAKEILDEVLRDGDEQQRASAQAMLKQL